MIRQPISLLKVASRSVYRSTKSSIAARALSSSSDSTSSAPSTPEQPPIKDDALKAAPSVTRASDIIPSKPYIPLYHHEDPTLFPQLLPGSLPYLMHNFSSAFNAVVSLFTSQETRDKFISIADLNREKLESGDNNSLYGSIINTNVVGQSDLGFIKVLALFDGLNSPLFEGTQFNIIDFMDGAGYAIERFHEVGRAHMEVLKNKVEAAGEESVEYDFIKIAESETESLEHDLMEMTTPVYWGGFNETIQALVGAPTFLLDILKQGSSPDSKITHVSFCVCLII